MSSMPRGSYKDQYHQRLYVQLNQGHNKLDYRRINQIREQMRDGVDEYAHMQHDEADALGLNKH
ncbi:MULTISPECIES: hypothetical protein [Brevibacillus]|jgi:hypothetical protein|uniref:Uncharacterized protein n=1 Tax=Brevibacillus thermoruber TaxID=33942 RepID=A0A9X3TQQ8_9BACL|nr:MULTISPECIES: hypothetical protein [Brevibacillus]MDA5109027.1 hypothetical protein [Brevibacillus thermoruber]UYZ12389.1 hypothetical protein A6764_16425 [Brevibacillus sp. WF146]